MGNNKNHYLHPLTLNIGEHNGSQGIGIGDFQEVWFRI